MHPTHIKVLNNVEHCWWLDLNIENTVATRLSYFSELMHLPVVTMKSLMLTNLIKNTKKNNNTEKYYYNFKTILYFKM